MTVSNAFSRPDQLSAALREKILAAAAELGYAGPDPAARTLARGSTGTVGILFHGTPRYALSDDVAALFLAVVAEELGRDGLALTLLPTSARGTWSRCATSRWTARSSTPAARSTSTSSGCAAGSSRSCSSTSRPTTASRASTSTTARARCAAATHLVEFGHRRIALLATAPERVLRYGPAPWRVRRCHRILWAVANPDDRYVPRERLRGWRDALGPAGITPVPRHVERSDGEEAYAAARELLAAPDRPTAVLAFSDALAADVLRAAADLRLRVPADVSVDRLRRLPARTPPHPRADHGASGRRREGEHGGGGAGGGDPRAPRRRRGAGPAPPAGDRAGAAGGRRRRRPTPSAERTALRR